MQINIYMRQAVTEALGPGKRYALWVQGCRRRCKGCISPDSRSFDGGSWMDAAGLAEEIVQTKAVEGITISGGEPFLQAEALCELIACIKSKKDHGVIVYTGNSYEQLLHCADVFVQKLLSYTDILIDGEYIEDLNDGKSLRGSSNQRVLFLTSRYEGERESFGKDGRNVELYIRKDRMRMVGIPSKEIMDRLGLENCDSKKGEGNIWQ